MIGDEEMAAVVEALDPYPNMDEPQTPSAAAAAAAAASGPEGGGGGDKGEGGATSMRAAEVETAEAVGVEADGTILYVLQLDLDEQARDLP